MSKDSDLKHALYVPQGFAVHTNGSDGVYAIVIDGMDPCTWVTVCSTNPNRPFLAATHADVDTNLSAFIEEAVRSGRLGMEFKVQMGSKHESGTYELAGEQVDLTLWYEKQVAEKTQGLGGAYSIHSEDSGSVIIGVDGNVAKANQSPVIFLEYVSIGGQKLQERPLRSTANIGLYTDVTRFNREFDQARDGAGKDELKHRQWSPPVIWRNGDIGEEVTPSIRRQKMDYIERTKQAARERDEVVAAKSTPAQQQQEEQAQERQREVARKPAVPRFQHPEHVRPSAAVQSAAGFKSKECRLPMSGIMADHSHPPKVNTRPKGPDISK